MKRYTIALLSGGNSPERDISISSGNQVFDALDKKKYNVVRYDPLTDLVKLIMDAPRINAALIILYGPNGEDGTVQGLLELLGIPYQGAGVLGSALAMDKIATKHCYEKAGVPTPSYLIMDSVHQPSPEYIVAELGLPVVIKPSSCGSSIGMSIIKTVSGVSGALEKAIAEDHKVLIEKYIEGTEITCGVLGNEDLQALPLIEIIPDKFHDFFDYEAKYVKGVSQEICPARIEENLAKTAQRYAITAHQSLWCSGYSRTDMIVKGDKIYVLETNTIPGMTPTSLFPKAAKVAGI